MYDMKDELVTVYQDGFCEQMKKTDVFALVERYHKEAVRRMAGSDAEHIIYAIKTYNEKEELESVTLFGCDELSDDELANLTGKYFNSIFLVLHKGTCKGALSRL